MHHSTVHNHPDYLFLIHHLNGCKFFSSTINNSAPHASPVLRVYFFLSFFQGKKNSRISKHSKYLLDNYSVPKLSWATSHWILNSVRHTNPIFQKVNLRLRILNYTEQQHEWVIPNLLCPCVFLLKIPVLSSGSWQSTPSTNVGRGAILKGRTPGQTKTAFSSFDTFFRGPLPFPCFSALNIKKKN